MPRPETIENRWDILYRDYPEVYEAFSKVKRKPVKDFGKMLKVKGKVVVDVASGTGRSTFIFAMYAKRVIGVEPEAAMMKIARETLAKNGLTNVTFLEGTSDHIPLPDHSAEIVAAITSASLYDVKSVQNYAKEAERVLVKGGFIYSVDVAPGWYGGDLDRVILGRYDQRKDMGYIRDQAFTDLGFKHTDFYSYQEFDSLEHIISTYGFIFGKKAIEYLKTHNQTIIKWKGRVYSKEVK